MTINTIRTAVLLMFLSTILISIGYIIKGTTGALISFIMALSIVTLLCMYSDRLILKMYNAKPAKEKDYALYYKIIDKLTKRADIKPPKLYIIDSTAPNAFTTGRNKNNTTLVVTKGLLQICNDKELECVLAHELGHIKNNDIMLMSITGAIAGAISYLGELVIWTTMPSDNIRHPLSAIPLIILAPFSAMIMHLSMSTDRVYNADRFSTSITDKSKDLVSAIEKISREVKYRPIKGLIHGTAHMFFINPLTGNFSTMLCTHPQLKNRIQRLEK
ncbi:MAG: M48 family metalloprotease [Candidatus Aenigmarchaeota archaeon]|nr:M48 family metalloprotease [Candidatus Aenigmarchaeota archaeon]